MKKSIRILNIVLIFTAFFLLSSCFNKGDNPSNLNRLQKLEEVKKQTENLEGITKINGSIVIYMGELKTSYRNMTYTFNNNSALQENEVSYLEENYKLNTDPYGELYIKEVVQNTFTVSDITTKLSISECLVKESFIDGIFSVYVSDDYATLHGNVEPNVIEKFLGELDDISEISKVSVDIECTDNRLTSYTLKYTDQFTNVVISYSFIY